MAVTVAPVGRGRGQHDGRAALEAADLDHLVAGAEGPGRFPQQAGLVVGHPAGDVGHLVEDQRLIEAVRSTAGDV